MPDPNNKPHGKTYTLATWADYNTPSFIVISFVKLTSLLNREYGGDLRRYPVFTTVA